MGRGDEHLDGLVAPLFIWLVCTTKNPDKRDRCAIDVLGLVLLKIGKYIYQKHDSDDRLMTVFIYWLRYPTSVRVLNSSHIRGQQRHGFDQPLPRFQSVVFRWTDTASYITKLASDKKRTASYAAALLESPGWPLKQMFFVSLVRCIYEGCSRRHAKRAGRRFEVSETSYLQFGPRLSGIQLIHLI